jgi:mannose-6-phosphate isomerase
MKLPTKIVEKPWGRTDIPPAFGDFGGRRIGEIWFEDPAGASAPLMVKFLFTSERLSIQVHPDDAAARAYGHPRGKEECWLVLDAAPGAELGVGLARDSSTDELRAAAGAGTIERLIDWRPARAGDFIYNSAGTIHAIGPGLTVVEVQQNVDLTYRLYDYGRPRELHLDAGLAVARTTMHRDPRDCHVPGTGTLTLVAGPHFTLVRATGPLDPAIAPAGADLTLVPLGPGCTIDGEPLALGECAKLTTLANVTLDTAARALIGWPL